MDDFTLVGARPSAPQPAKKQPWYRGLPLGAMLVLALIILGCLSCGLFLPRDPTYMDLANCNVAPCREFLFGTDAMGRDIFSMIWYGGRASLTIGFLGAAISTVIAALLGTLSGCAGPRLDALLMRGMEIFLSVPHLLLIVLLQAILGTASVWTLSLVIGVTGWAGIAKVVRTEVRRLRTSEYVLAARCMGGGFFHVLWEHLAPNFLSAILFMVVMNVQSAILAESTLSFLGLGLPLEVISWGSMLSLAQQALLTKSWWAVVGSPVSIRSITDYLISSGRKISPNTVNDYVEALTESFIFYPAERFDIAGKQLLKVNKKLYIVDLGLRNHILPRRSYDLGFSLENLVYLELLRRGYKVMIGRIGNTEVDFVAEKQGAYTYYQVTADMTAQETFEREMRPLAQIRDNYEKIILTADRLTVGNYNGIRVKNLTDWLLGKEN